MLRRASGEAAVSNLVRAPGPWPGSAGPAHSPRGCSFGHAEAAGTAATSSAFHPLGTTPTRTGARQDTFPLRHPPKPISPSWGSSAGAPVLQQASGFLAVPFPPWGLARPGSLPVAGLQAHPKRLTSVPVMRPATHADPTVIPRHGEVKDLVPRRIPSSSIFLYSNGLRRTAAGTRGPRTALRDLRASACVRSPAARTGADEARPPGAPPPPHGTHRRVRTSECDTWSGVERRSMIHSGVLEKPDETTRDCGPTHALTETKAGPRANGPGSEEPGPRRRK